MLWVLSFLLKLQLEYYFSLSFSGSHSTRKYRAEENNNEKAVSDLKPNWDSA